MSSSQYDQFEIKEQAINILYDFIKPGEKIRRTNCILPPYLWWTCKKKEKFSVTFLDPVNCVVVGVSSGYGRKFPEHWI